MIIALVAGSDSRALHRVRSPMAKGIRRHRPSIGWRNRAAWTRSPCCVDAGRSNRDERAAPLARIEQRINDLAKPAVIAGVARWQAPYANFVFVAGVAVCELTFFAGDRKDECRSRTGIGMIAAV